MSYNSKIEWTDATWNPIAGCTKCSPGCLNCYAERMALRLNGIFAAKGDNDSWAKMSNVLKWDYSKPELYEFGKATGWNGQVELFPNRLDQPLHWRKPRRIFVCSMSDLFHKKVPLSFIGDVFEIIRRTPRHTHLILTKRIKRMVSIASQLIEAHGAKYFNHVQWGVSISNQTEAYEKIPILLKIPAAVRWLSIEPMLGSIEIKEYLKNTLHRIPDGDGLFVVGGHRALDWVVVGGESGPGARPMHPDWVRKIRDQCVDAGVPFFMKQMGGHPKKRNKLEDIPNDLRIREYPNAR